jgi:hypothetical protein
MAAEDTSAPTKKHPTSRAEAGLVEEGAEIQVQDEAIANKEFLDFEAVEEAGALVQANPSATNISGMSEEEQFMDMTPVVVGPPAYGSPNPVTAAGRLLPLTQHPFNVENLPEDHPAAIDTAYGEGYQADLTASELGTSFPGAPQRTDLETALLGTGEGEGGTGTATDYASQTKADLLTEAQNRGLDVTNANTKDEIIAALQADDAAA